MTQDSAVAPEDLDFDMPVGEQLELPSGAWDLDLDYDRVAGASESSADYEEPT